MVRVNPYYFEDLVELIKTDNIRNDYTVLINNLYNTEFRSPINEDQNRVIDAENLRAELGGSEFRFISMLEVMIALAKRCHEDIMYGYTIDGVSSSTAYWFWTMVENCGLDQVYDSNPDSLSIFYKIIEPIKNRSYNFDGSGGFFPLHHPEMDQRFCELWYQMNAYLVENYPF